MADDLVDKIAALPAFEALPLEDAQIFYLAEFLEKEQADKLLKSLSHSLKWQQDEILMFGKSIPIPRLQAWYGDAEAHYRYSGLDLAPTSWTTELEQLRTQLQHLSGQPFNAVLANLYRDGQDSVGWHSDNEPELGPEPIIASVSLGAERRFCLRHKKHKTRQFNIKLPHGSLLLMAAGTQQHWVHALPKQKTISAARINLSFRNIINKQK